MSFIYTDTEIEDFANTLNSCVSFIEEKIKDIWEYSFPKVKDALSVLFRYNLTPTLKRFSSDTHED